MGSIRREGGEGGVFLCSEEGSVLVISSDSIWGGFVYTLHVAHCIVRLLGRVCFIGRDSIRLGYW